MLSVPVTTLAPRYSVFGSNMIVGELGSGRVHDDGHVSTRRSGVDRDGSVNRDTEVVAAAASIMSGCVGGHCC